VLWAAHERQLDLGLLERLAGEQGRVGFETDLPAQALHRPQRRAPVEAQGTEGVSLGQQLQRPAPEARPEREILQRAGAGKAGGDQPFDLVLLQPLDLPQPQADGFDRIGG